MPSKLLQIIRLLWPAFPVLAANALVTAMLGFTFIAGPAAPLKWILPAHGPTRRGFGSGSNRGVGYGSGMVMKEKG